jgi:hypothetical protein
VKNIFKQKNKINFMKSNTKNDKNLITIQKFLNLFLLLCFALSIIPFIYYFLYKWFFIFLFIQIIISFIRKSTLNIFIELIIFFLGILAFLPIISILPKLLCIGILIFEFLIFTDKKIYNITKKSFDNTLNKLT